MDNYENHYTEYSKRSQESESKKGFFLTIIFLAFVGFVFWIYNNYDIAEIRARKPKQDFVSVEKPSAEKQNVIDYGSLKPKRYAKTSENTVKKKVVLPPAKSSDTVASEKQSEKGPVGKLIPTDEGLKRQEALQKQQDEQDKLNSKIEEIVGQKRPKELYKNPFNYDITLFFPVSPTWLEFVIRKFPIPVRGTIYCKESTETEENYIFRDYYYLKYINNGQDIVQVKFVTVKQSVDGKNFELYEYFSGDKTKRTLCWSGKYSEGIVTITYNINKNVYKFIFNEDRYIVNKNDQNFAEVFLEQSTMRACRCEEKNVFITSFLKKNIDKEKQLYFSFATFLFNDDITNARVVVFLECLRLEEIYNKDKK